MIKNSETKTIRKIPSEGIAKILKRTFPKKETVGAGYQSFDIELESNSFHGKLIAANEAAKFGANQNKKRRVVAKGSLPFLVEKGQSVILSGVKVSFDPKFLVHTITFTSGRLKHDELNAFREIPGIGNSTMKKLENIIINHGGSIEAVFVPDDYQTKLWKGGITSSEKAALLRHAFDQSLRTTSDSLFLYKMGIETKFVKQIEEIYYGTSVESGILSDPFRLMEVPGIRFPKIDRIYRKTSNYDPINPRRLKYGVVYALEESKNVKESMYLLQSEIGSYILQELEIPKTEKTKQAVKNTVSELTFTGEIVAIEIGEERRYYARSSILREKKMAEKIVKMTKTEHPNPIPENFIENRIEKFMEEKGMRFSDEQIQAIYGVLKENISVLTGGPGTGKTTVQSCIVRVIREWAKFQAHKLAYSDEEKQEVLKMSISSFSDDLLVLAPTGMAAKRISSVADCEALTIHRGLGYNPFRGFDKNQESPIEESRLLVDESSMISFPIDEKLFEAIEPGKTAVSFIGDVDQLPSIGAGRIFDDLISSDIVPIFRLTKIFRQGDGSSIIENAYKVRDGKVDFIFDSSTEFIEMETPEKLEERLMLASEKLGHDELIRMKDRIDEYYRKRYYEIVLEKHREYGLSKNDSVVLSPMKEGYAGTSESNVFLQKFYNPNGASVSERNRQRIDDFSKKYDSIYTLEGIETSTSIITENDKVIQTENDYDIGIVNGDVGIVEIAETECNGKSCRGYLEAVFSGERFCLTSAQSKNLELAYSYTVHKSQGSEYDTVIIPVFRYFSSMLLRKLYFTAMTRAKKRVIFIGRKSVLAYVSKNGAGVTKRSGIVDIIFGRYSKFLENAGIPYNDFGITKNQ